MMRKEADLTLDSLADTALDNSSCASSTEIVLDHESFLGASDFSDCEEVSSGACSTRQANMNFFRSLASRAPAPDELEEDDLDELEEDAVSRLRLCARCVALGVPWREAEAPKLAREGLCAASSSSSRPATVDANIAFFSSLSAARKAREASNDESDLDSEEESFMENIRVNARRIALGA